LAGFGVRRNPEEELFVKLESQRNKILILCLIDFKDFLNHIKQSVLYNLYMMYMTRFCFSMFAKDSTAAFLFFRHGTFNALQNYFETIEYAVHEAHRALK
jgi:hypothetical protein